MSEKPSKIKSVEAMRCPIRHMLDIIGGKWKMLIICMLSDGSPARYSTIKRKLGDITNVMLSQSLKELESTGIVHREQYNEVPPRVEYSLTPKGNSIVPPLYSVVNWAADNMQDETVGDVYCEKCQAIT